jgi:hypothetical protein
LRNSFWISQPITGPAAAMNIGKIACFESSHLGTPPALVGDLFRGLFPFLDYRNSQIVAMPLLAAGDQGWPADAMLRAVLDAAVHWLARGLPITELKIVERRPERAAALLSEMTDFKSKMTSETMTAPKRSVTMFF